MEFITLYSVNLYYVLHIASSSLKSSNVPFMLYNYMQCTFFKSQHYFLGRNDICSPRDWRQKGHLLFKPPIYIPPLDCYSPVESSNWSLLFLLFFLPSKPYNPNPTKLLLKPFIISPCPLFLFVCGVEI